MRQPEITVGLSASVSGKFWLQGQQALNGVLLWQAYANAQGGISLEGISRRIRLIWYDDESHGRGNRKNVLRLLRDDQVDILLGPYSSNLTMAAAEVAEEHQKVLWNYGGTSDEIFGQGWRYIVAISSPASSYFRSLPRWLAHEYPQLRQICVLYSAKGTFGRQVNLGLREVLRKTELSVESVPIDPFLKHTDDTPSMLRRIDPEAVVLASGFENELAILRTRSQWPSSVRAIAAVAAGLANFGRQLGPTSEGVIGPSQWEPTMSFPEILGPASGWFVNKYNEQFGSRPDYVAAASFATGLIVSECIRRSETLDSSRLRCLASELECNTFYGSFRIDPYGGRQLGHRILLVRWQQGSKMPLPGSVVHVES
jgi:branched-chain amino acid transport system substrate-binding protein